jgi:predicted glycosyltransferase
MITGASGVHGFAWPEGVDHIKLPTVRKQANGRWRPQSLDIAMEDLQRLRRTIILEAIRAYRPHLFVADFLPLGVDGELVPALEVLRSRSDARTVIGFRDILDDPADIRATWERERIPEAIESLYDRVLVYGDPDWFDFAAYGLRTDLPRYVGLLGERNGNGRARSSRPDIRVTASCGGGSDGYAVLAAALEAAPLVSLELDQPVSCNAVTGPLMPEPDVERLRAIALRTGGRVRRFVDDLKSKLYRSHAVVGMAGYNTVCEVMAAKVPAVMIPRSGPSSEQPIRARIFDERGLGVAVPLSHATGEDVGRALVKVLNAGGYPGEALPQLDGIGHSVDALLELLP